MILGQNSWFGNNFLSGTSPILPELSSFDSITFANGGNNTMVLSQIYGNDIVITKDYLDSYNVDPIPIWVNNVTYLLALFINSISAGNIIGFNGEIIEWAIFRENTTNNTLAYIGSTTGEQRKFIDYTSVQNNNYRYYLYAKTATEMSSGLVSNYVSSQYYGWYLIDADDDVIYSFYSEISGGEENQNINYTEFESNQQYKSYSVGNMNYMSGTLSGIVTNARNDNDYVPNNSIELLDGLREFIKDNTKTKYLKNRKGEIFHVFTYGYSQTPLDQAIAVQPMVVSFSWEEVGKVGY